MASLKVELESLSQFCKKGRLGFSCFGQYSLNESETKKISCKAAKGKELGLKNENNEELKNRFCSLETITLGKRVLSRLENRSQE